jgi:SAM-dependent methyltransferase
MFTLPGLLKPVKVTRDFKALYEHTADPWNIGDADSPRYSLYHSLLNKHIVDRTKVLDIGCGYGAFLARFRNSFEQLVGIEVSEAAIRNGRGRYPDINFVQGSAAELERTVSDRYDAIIFSDVIYYLDDRSKKSSLAWISKHLTNNGIALIAAWCPGGQYLKPKELRRLVATNFTILEERLLESQHAVFVCRKLRRFIAVTVDYETWQPIPEGKTIAWDRDVFRPTTQLLETFDAQKAKLTVMAELGEYFWLVQNAPELSRRMEEQWQETVARGHDVQLHLHPNWLPETGARCEAGKWFWDWSKRKADDYPGDLQELLHTCKATLERILIPVDAEYRVTSFRAGAYAAQPFKRLHHALSANGIFCDSSVFWGGVSAERGYDYRFAYSDHQPYFANSFDPQLKAPSCECQVLELPIFTFLPGSRWSFDGADGALFSERLLKYSGSPRNRSVETHRRIESLRTVLFSTYLKGHRRWDAVNRYIPRELAHWMGQYEPEVLAQDQYYVLIAHTKSDLDFDSIRRGLTHISQSGDFEFVTLSQMARSARAALSQAAAAVESKADVKGMSSTVSAMASAQHSSYLQSLIPLDRCSLLELGHGTTSWSGRIAKLYPWMTVTSVDSSAELIEKATFQSGIERLRFNVTDIGDLSFTNGSFDCVYADHSLVHTSDIDRTLREVFRVLRWGGVLVAAIPSDGRNSRSICHNHLWKTIPAEVRLRMNAAGFVNLELEEVDTFGQFGMLPYPPSNDKIMYIRAWKRRHDVSKMDRALEAMAWVYTALEPEQSSTSNDGCEILANGHAFCMGYTLVLGQLLQREGMRVRWLTMMAKDHPRGRGDEKVDSHEMLLLSVDGKEVILDPTTNVCIPRSLNEVLENPKLAEEKRNPDARYLARGYNLYGTEFWFSRVFKYAVRSKPEEAMKWINCGATGRS